MPFQRGVWVGTSMSEAWVVDGGRSLPAKTRTVTAMTSASPRERIGHVYPALHVRGNPGSGWRNAAMPVHEMRSAAPALNHKNVIQPSFPRIFRNRANRLFRHA